MEKQALLWTLAGFAIFVSIIALLISWMAFNMAQNDLANALDQRIQSSLPENNDHDPDTNTPDLQTIEYASDIGSTQ